MHTKKKCILTVAGGEKETETHLKIQKKKKLLTLSQQKNIYAYTCKIFQFFRVYRLVYKACPWTTSSS